MKNQTGPYFWVKDREKAVHVHIFTDELEMRKKKQSQMMFDKDAADQVGLSPHFCHLHDVGELCQAGDGDHIVVGFQFVPAEVRTHMNIYDVGKHSYQLGRR